MKNLFSRLFISILLGTFLIGFWLLLHKPVSSLSIAQTLEWPEFFQKYILPQLPIVDGFDYPLKTPKGDTTWLRHKFMESKNLGEAWGYGEKDECLGEPVYAVADGWVLLSIDFESYWGTVIITNHRMPEGSKPSTIECLYARLRSANVEPGQFIRRGQKIGEIGNTDIIGTAHLYFELRDRLGLQLGPTDWQGEKGWLNPSEFISTHRPEP